MPDALVNSSTITPPEPPFPPSRSPGLAGPHIFEPPPPPPPVFAVPATPSTLGPGLLGPGPHPWPPAPPPPHPPGP